MNNDEYFSNINVNDIAVFYLYKVQACFFFFIEQWYSMQFFLCILINYSAFLSKKKPHKIQVKNTHIYAAYA